MIRFTEEGLRDPAHNQADYTKADSGHRQNQADAVLRALRGAGPSGCLNTELWAICHALNSRAADLRKLGHDIRVERVDRGVYRYTLIEPIQGTLALCDALEGRG